MLAPAVVPPPTGRPAPPPPAAAVASPVAAPGVLPDVAVSTAPGTRRRLDRVGMDGVQAVAAVTVDGRPALLPATCEVTVSLDALDSRGIHMSRLYLRAQEALEKGLTPGRVRDVLADMLASHELESRSAFLDVALTLPVRQPSLVSGQSGWRHYPVRAGGRLTPGGTALTAAVRVEYSSTCPCSAALSRDLTAAALRDRFGDFHGTDGSDRVRLADVAAWLDEEGAIAGHPHSQRSVADLAVTLTGDAESFGWQDLIESAETALATATQGAVKRADEREFARLNAENPMFCEDAARRLVTACEAVPHVAAYDIAVRHMESLHPHDAVARVSGRV